MSTMAVDSQGEELVSKIVLDVKALTLLSGSDDHLRGLLRRDILDSRDEGVKRFVGLLQTGGESNRGGALFMAIGEMVLAALLAIMGIVAFVPSLIGVTTPQSLVNYLSGFVTESLGSSSVFSVVVVLEFGFAVLLMLGSLYTLREAAYDLKQAGLVIDASER
jgi:hypothetical protein